MTEHKGRPWTIHLTAEDRAALTEIQAATGGTWASIIRMALRRLLSWVREGWRPPSEGGDSDPTTDPSRVDIH